MISVCMAWLCVPEVSVRLPRAVSCGDPAVLPWEQWEWLSLILPFGFTFFLILFLFCLLCLLPVRVPALEPEISMKSLVLPEPFFPFLPHGQV